MFNPDKCAAVLNPVGRSHTRTTITQTPVAIPQVDQFSTIVSLVKDIRVILNPTPRTLTHSAQPNPTITWSPVLPSPSQLTQFLSYAKTHLGVPDALVYKSTLHHKHYRPDILYKVQDSALEKLGIQPGDVILYVSRKGQLPGEIVLIYNKRGATKKCQTHHLQSVWLCMREGLMKEVETDSGDLLWSKVTHLMSQERKCDTNVRLTMPGFPFPKVILSFKMVMVMRTDGDLFLLMHVSYHQHSIYPTTSILKIFTNNIGNYNTRLYCIARCLEIASCFCRSDVMTCSIYDAQGPILLHPLDYHAPSCTYILSPCVSPDCSY